MAARRLVIMRHGKAEQSESKRDVDRALIDRGRADARLGGDWLVEQGLAPDVVLCSPSVRTKSTWHEVAIGMAEAGGTASPAVTYVRDLYDSGLAAALDCVRAVPAEATVVLLIGHNPTVSALSHRLDERAATALSTSGIAVHEVTDEWSTVAAAPLNATHTPRAT
ncbi:MAG TPA: histidine phosphatase family protein [Micromonosporaceae bacterium]|jgi:phosphohistidine phosphatase